MTLLNQFKTRLKKHQNIIKWYYRIQILFKKLVFMISPVLLAKLRFRYIRGRWPNLKYPKIFDEKLIWLMLYWRHPLKSLCADKYSVRTYVQDQGLANILPKLLGVYEKSSDIDFSVLPERFVLKCTHGWGFNIICNDKNKLNIKDTKKKLDNWIKTDVRKWASEIHYTVKPRIICEEFLGDPHGYLPSDYKVLCFHGKAYCTMVCTERSTGNPKFNFYDKKWDNKLPYDKNSLKDHRYIKIPDAYEDIVNAAEKLAKPFPFVRVDFYSINGKAVLSEMTFTPNACVDTELTDIAQIELGSLINIPEKL